MKSERIRIIFNIDKDTKDEFSKVCLDLGVNMTDVMLASIKEFINKAKTSK